jgi:transcriptional regulator with XRE-family HTH domain
MYDFGSRLKAIRNQRGLTQRKLAEEIGKSVQAVSSYERNSQIPPIEVMISIADVLNVSLDYLVDRQSVNTYSFCNLKSIHKEILDLLQDEFASPSRKHSHLSDRQSLIFEKLLMLFVLPEHIDS